MISRFPDEPLDKQIEQMLLRALRKATGKYIPANVLKVLAIEGKDPQVLFNYNDHFNTGKAAFALDEALRIFNANATIEENPFSNPVSGYQGMAGTRVTLPVAPEKLVTRGFEKVFTNILENTIDRPPPSQGRGK